MKNLLAILVLLLSTNGLIAQNMGTLQGKITEEGSGEPVIFCNLTLFKNGVEATGGTTDLDGNYSIGNLDPGKYDVEVTYVGFQPQLIQGVIINAGRVIKLDVVLSPGLVLSEVEIKAYKVPLIEQDNTTQGRTITSEEIRNLPLKDINAIASSTAGISSIDGESVAVRGSRPNGTDYYIDGIRVQGGLVPQFEIEQLQVITGGLEAMYGDVTGGVISITTKGPANRFGGGAEFETSKFLDDFGYSEANLNLSGPIIKRNNQSLLGFRVSGRYVYREDDNPSAIGVYRAPLDVIERLEENPLGVPGGTQYIAGETLKDGDVNLLKTRPNEQRKQVDLTGRLDARLSNAIDISLGGSYRDFNDRFTPGGNARSPRGWGLLNYNNNPYDKQQSFRTNFRFRHRLGMTTSASREADQGKKPSTIQNAAYTLQVGYERTNRNIEDSRHGDNFFRYGHIGDFPLVWNPTFEEVNNIPVRHNGWLREMETAYTAGPHNPVLANYNNILSDEEKMNFDNYLNRNGFRNTAVDNVYNFFSNVGEVYNSYFKSEQNIFTLNLNASFDFLPGGSERGRHSIQFGILHEQRVERSYNLQPFNLYNLADLSVNSHLLTPDTSAMAIDTVNGIPVYPPIVTELSGRQFYKSVRERFNYPIDRQFNIYGIDPDLLSLDLFSAAELADQNVVNFNGYDYLGNKISRNVSFNDFFEERDADGNRKFLVTPNQPIYQAFFIQDKFTYKDIIFRLGVRVDRFDANTQVMKDPYSLYDIMSADDFYNRFGGERPGNIGADYKVYTQSEGSTIVRAFRDGEQWYRGNGTPVNDGNLIWGGELVTPRYYDDLVNDIKSIDFDPDRSFEAYKPQLNWMPRVSVSFPISDEANFFAHYDILVQRPPSNSFESPMGYYYFIDFPSSQNNPRNNPALRPEQTIDYEVGFQQRLTSASAIKMSAFYREMRDMIQIREFLYVPPPVNRYTSFDNLDFGTVKGFQFQYELRRTRNISLLANYTLQFADGTGSDATSQRGISQRGNLRTLFPLSRDERHALKGVFDFRYDSGKLYNGPRVYGKDIFANAGFNIQFNAISGRPYTRNLQATSLGGEGFVGAINGARLPWNYNIDLRAEKTFKLTAPEAARQVNMTLSFRVLNLLDTRNIRGVYSASGSPYDSGYLSSPNGAASIRNLSNTTGEGRNLDSFLTSTQWALLNPGFFSLPRRIFLAALFDF